MNLKTSFSQMLSQIRQKDAAMKEHGGTLPVHVCYSIFLAHLVHTAIRFVLAMVYVDYSLMLLHPVYTLFWCIAPVLLYLWGTAYSFYNYRHTKYCCLVAVLSSEYLMILSFAFYALSRIFLPGILSLPVDEAFTKGMVVLLGRLATQLPLVLSGVLLAKAVFLPLKDETIQKKIMEYKITHSTSPDRNSPSDIAYNMNIVKDIHSGKNITVYAKDRYLHTLVDGMVLEYK